MVRDVPPFIFMASSPFFMFVSQDSQEAGLFDIKYLVNLDIEGTHSKKRWLQLISIREAKNQTCVTLPWLTVISNLLHKHCEKQPYLRS